jgi:hypothetical protein
MDKVQRYRIGIGWVVCLNDCNVLIEACVDGKDEIPSSSTLIANRSIVSV